MDRNLAKKSKITATFIALLLMTAFITSLLPQATSTITTITPNSGPVGTTVRVVGEIDTTNGSYVIYFDDEEVKNGTAMDRTVNDTLIVPHRPEGNYTVRLHDVTGNTNDTATFTIETAYYIEAVVPTQPEQLQEGELTEILVNVTGGAENTRYWANITIIDPSGAVYYNDTLQLTNTTSTGHGEGNRTYPTDFSSGAHINYTGTYEIAFNKTLATESFFIGLTNATEYGRFQFVGVRAAGYQPSESVWVNITFVGEDVISIQKNASTEGVIEASWEIPGNASMGLYTVTIANSTTPGTIKPIPDTQNFTIVEIPFQVQTKKLDGEVLADVKIDVYNATSDWIASDKTDEEGLASFSVEGGNYTIEASWAIKSAEYVLVGTLINQSIKKSVNLTLWCWIVHLKIAISPPLPFINLTLTYHYDNKTITSSFETNSTGIIKTYYMPTNISYTIEARRYGFTFYNETIQYLSAEMDVTWVNITITCPTYTMSVKVLDSKGESLSNVQVNLMEWSSWDSADSGTTDNQGNVNLSATFGRYKVKVYDDNAVLGQEVVLNETMIDLIEDELSVVVHCKIFNIDLSVKTLDFFGQPVPNAMVKIERKFGQEWIKIGNSTTGLDGIAPLNSIVGGDYRISIYLAGKLAEIKQLYLDESKQILFKIDTYAIIGWYPVEIVQLITYISIVLLVVVFSLALTYRRLLRRFLKKKSESEE